MLFARDMPKILNRKVESVRMKEHSQALISRVQGQSIHSEQNLRTGRRWSPYSDQVFNSPQVDDTELV